MQKEAIEPVHPAMVNAGADAEQFGHARLGQFARRTQVFQPFVKVRHIPVERNPLNLAHHMKSLLLSARAASAKCIARTIRSWGVMWPIKVFAQQFTDRFEREARSKDTFLLAYEYAAQQTRIH
jgi:hypothetical protein